MQSTIYITCAMMMIHSDLFIEFVMYLYVCLKSRQEVMENGNLLFLIL